MSEARARVLTPPGAAAIAVIEVAGGRAAGALATVFRGKRGRPALPGPGRAAVGTIVDGEGAAVDEVVVVRRGAGTETGAGSESRTSTSTDVYEICTHGGAGAVAGVMAALRGAGVEAAGAAPVPLAARARTWLGFRVATFVEEGLLAPEDPLLGSLLAPRRAVLAGAPNAGKSSLFNALLERERSLVSPEPRTTRDVIEEETALAGVPVVLCDTAGTEEGWRDENENENENDTVERAAARRARDAAAAADLVIRCVDRSRTAPPGALEGGARTLLVLTKADLPAAFEAPPGAIAVSALRGTGLDRLALAIATRLLGRDPRTVARPEARRIP